MLAYNVPSQYWDMAGARGEGSVVLKIRCAIANPGRSEER